MPLILEPALNMFIPYSSMSKLAMLASFLATSMSILVVVGLFKSRVSERIALSINPAIGLGISTLFSL